MSDEQSYRIGETIANRYVIDRKLGQSPSAELFLVTDQESQKSCAKVYLPHLRKVFFQSSDFLLRAASITSFQHANFSPVLEINEEMGRIYMIREYTEGLNWLKWVENNPGPSQRKQGAELLWQICQVLQELHSIGNHLNIHPGNVFIEGPLAKLCDPDLRAMAGLEVVEPLPRPSETMGYIAPEARGRINQIYPSSDLYSVAGLVFFLASGKHPPSDPELLNRQCDQFEPQLSGFLKKALHLKPEGRFPSAGPFSDALWELSDSLSRQTNLSAPVQPEHSFMKETPHFPSQKSQETDFFASDPQIEQPSKNTEINQPPPPPQTPDQPTSPPPQFGPSPQDQGFQTIAEFPPPSREKTLPAKGHRPPSEPAGKGETLFGMLQDEDPPPSYNKQTASLDQDDAFEAALQEDNNNSQPVTNYGNEKSQSRKWIFVAVAASLAVLAGSAAFIIIIANTSDTTEVSNNSSPDPLQSEPPTQASDEPNEIENLASPEPAMETQEPAPVEDTPRYPSREQKDFTENNWPNSPKGMLEMADKLYEQGKPGWANRVYAKAFDFPGMNVSQKVWAWGGLAVTYKDLNDYNAALSSIDSLLSISPDNSWAQKYRQNLNQ